MVPLPKTGSKVRRRYLAYLIHRPWTRRASRSRALRRYLDSKGYITPHFTWQSYADTRGVQVPHALRENAIRFHWRLEVFRHALGDVPMTVDGPYRTVQHNADIGGAVGSYHTKACAGDFFVQQVDRWPGSRAHVLAIAERVFANGGVGNETSGTLHLDTRGYRSRFVTW